MIPKLMFVLVSPETMKKGYGHTHLVYVAEQWRREGRPQVMLCAYEEANSDKLVECFGPTISHQFLTAILEA